MADEADMAHEREQNQLDYAMHQARKAAAAIPAGEPGECQLCGEESPRLVDGACAPCRDRQERMRC